MKKITPFLWFDKEALEAARFYVRIFKPSKLGRITYAAEGMPNKEGSVLTVEFSLRGQEFIALNGSPDDKFNPAISFLVYCDTQKEVDYYWKRLSAGGKKLWCGWLTDKYGVTWQITPAMLMKQLGSKDKAKKARVMQAMMKMEKLDIRRLEKAAKG